MLLRLEGLALAGIQALTDRPERALEAVEGVAPFDDHVLERARKALRAQIARRLPLERHELIQDQLARWADGHADPRTRATVAGWWAWLRYRQNRFEECAELHFEAASGERWVTERLEHLVQGASALMESFRHDEAMRWGTTARDLAARFRLPTDEARAERVLRGSGYRAGLVHASDLELVEATAGFGVPDLEANVCNVEAIIAWRAQLWPEARELAERARTLWRVLGKVWPSRFARAVAIASGANPTMGEIASLARDAAACPISGLGIQILGLLGPRLPARPAPAEVAPAARQVPLHRWDKRIDAMSVDEALARLGLTGPEILGVAR